MASRLEGDVSMVPVTGMMCGVDGVHSASSTDDLLRRCFLRKRINEDGADGMRIRRRIFIARGEQRGGGSGVVGMLSSIRIK